MNMVGTDVYLKYKEMLGNTVDVLFGNDHAGQGFQKLYVKKNGYDSEINMLRGGLDYCKKLRKRHIKTLRDLSLMWPYGNWTLDRRSRDVTKDVFKRLFKDGLIEVCDWPTYARIIHDKLELISAADVDAVSRQVDLYAYKTEINGIEIVINTTFPEFLYATTGVGVSSDLYKSLSSYSFTVPNLNRSVPFIDLGNVDSNRFIIPAHFESDYWLAKEKNLDIVNIVSLDGKLKNVPEELMNKPFKCIKDHLSPSFTKLYEVTRNLPVDILGRDDVSIIMLPAPNYVLNTKELARRALSILNNNEIDIKPTNRLHMLKNRLKNIRPWCISRYTWWGIRIPDVPQKIKHETENTSEMFSTPLVDSYNSTDASLVDGNEQDELSSGKSDASAHYRTLTFDTWFTSALWPIITGFTSGEGDKVLYTSYDILETWVCRMLLLCPYVAGTVPFNKLYLHGIVIDSRGKKMSKSSGNAMSIEELTEKFKSAGDLAMVDEVSQTRMLLSSLSSKSDFAYKLDLRTDRTSSLLKKLLEITNFVTKTTNELDIKYFWDVPEMEDLDFIQEAISTKLSQYGVSVGAYIEDFEFNKSLESLEKYVKVFSEYAISYLRFSNSKNLGWFIKYYTNMLRLFVPYATNFVLKMRLPLKISVTNELFVWPNFTHDNVENSRIKLSDALQELLPLLDNPEDPETIVSYSISEDEDEASNSAKSPYPADNIPRRSATEESDVTESNASSDVIPNSIIDADQGKRVEGSVGRGGIIDEGASFDLLDEVVREVRKGVKNGYSEVDVRVPADLYSEIFEHRGYIEYLAKLTYNKLPRVNLIRI